MAWGIVFAAFSLFGMFVLMIAHATQADDRLWSAETHAPENMAEMKKAA
jgi:hypothetical protein